MYIQRAAEETALRISKTFPVLLITGPRQAGKSTMLQKLARPERKVITLDDPDVRYLANEDPALFMQRFTPPVLIDEIQYGTKLLPYIKMAVDRSKVNGEYWLTGSQAFHMMQNVSESLAGRVGMMTLLGLSTSEINGVRSEPFHTNPDWLIKRAEHMPKMGLNDVYRRIFTGSMPQLYKQPETDWETYYRSYVDTYLQRDIRSLSQVGDAMAFFNFMTVAAARTAKPVIYEEIAKEVGISAPTAKQWLSLLVSSGIIALVQPYHNNILKRATKMPLLHFLDTGLCAYLQKWGNPEALEKGAMSGAFFESYVFSEIYKSYLNAGKEPPLYYYRDKEKHEIDILLYHNATLFPIEVKKAASPNKAAIRNFKALAPMANPETADTALTMEIGTGAVVCMAQDVLPIDQDNWLVPVWVI
jgi:uncharacterized protein